MCSIRPSRRDDHETLLALWRRSVEATHIFLSRQDIDFYYPLVRRFLASGIEILVLCDETTETGIMGFMVLDVPEGTQGAEAKIEALFIDPPHIRKGLGSRLVAFAKKGRVALTLDVNEANPNAKAFYNRMGFRKTGRSPVDGAGKPFPLVHMAWSAKE